MEDLIALALDTATAAGASYADIRLAEQESEVLTVKNGSLASASATFCLPLRTR